MTITTTITADHDTAYPVQFSHAEPDTPADRDRFARPSSRDEQLPAPPFAAPTGTRAHAAPHGAAPAPERGSHNTARDSRVRRGRRDR